MPLLRDYFTDGRGITYERTEDESSIEWRIANEYLFYTYNKPEKTWYSHHLKCPTVRREDGCYLETEFKNSQVPPQPQYCLVSRGKSFTGQEVIELHVYNPPRGIWQKMPVKVTIISELNWTLEELENWTKESWSTHR
jgi:hypothetical protein